MIIKIKKNIYTSKQPYAVTTPVGELLCKVVGLNGLYYVYNKVGDSIGQVLFDGATATISIKSDKPKFPASINIVCNPETKAIYFSNEISEEDKIYLQRIAQASEVKALSLRGRLADYSYDIYEDTYAFANVVPCATEKDYFQIRINENGNVLKSLLIALSIEHLSRI